ncbi:DUF6301 family protein [Nocardia sp. CS682]|uniref:DUF6301 family protein n=1 Tax=Nocardia sp. CS682 TaxID=1047172 RepID=UPI001074F656|nr:DUF6301 family protein [Nocardia sp. CS682]QBS39875.1 hypothetical protein DMB37_06735 [Nocardia sp. CS682]
MTDLDVSGGSSAAGWRELGDAELVDVADKLRSLVWSWRMDNLMRLLVVFGWQDPIFKSPDWVRFDSGLGPGTCDVMGRDGEAERIEVAVTTLAADDAAGRAGVHDAFARMTTALTATLGEPSARIADVIPEIRWSGEETTLLLTDLLLMVRLRLVTNTWLAEYDEANGVQGQSTI